MKKYIVDEKTLKDAGIEINPRDEYVEYSGLRADFLIEAYSGWKQRDMESIGEEERAWIMEKTGEIFSYHEDMHDLLDKVSEYLEKEFEKREFMSEKQGKLPM